VSAPGIGRVEDQGAHVAEVHGDCDSKFGELRDLLAASIASGADVGASVSVTLNGETVVDLWGGYTDEARSTAWQKDTITNVWSTTKTMAALSLLMLVDRGLVDVDAPVATYWPEFAANGKQNVLVRHVMGHTSGLSGWEQPVSPEDLLDWEKSTAMLAAMAPWWEPGSASGYHLISHGHLIGEILRRVDGRTLGRFFAEEIANPLGADFHIGLPEGEHHRVSNVIPPPPPEMDLSSFPSPEVALKSLTGPLLPGAEFSWTPQWRTAEVPAANGHGNARSVARIQSIVACGGTVDGTMFLSPETIEVIFREQSNGIDLVLGLPLRFGMGYGLLSPDTFPGFPAEGTCFWAGWGGSVIMIDTINKMTIAYVMNKMGLDMVGTGRGEALGRAAYRAIGFNG
jgi:CubicO group peptidase (beta-lactamase class C family)